ncbi:hypothetical protein HDE_10764 [Halotydeus destructor]|nr:hypothetical protein HDE_10764 [Halotydeus destructor]
MFAVSRAQVLNRLICSFRCHNGVKSYSKQAKATGDEEVEEEPVKYSGSKAHTEWRAAYNFRDPHFEEHTPPSQRYVVIASLAAFMIYFCVLREENDLDEKMYQPLSKTMPELEVPLIEAAIREHRRLNMSTQQLEERLAELKHQSTIKAIMSQKK